SFRLGKRANGPFQQDQHVVDFLISDIERAIYAKLVQKCGNRHHWEDWANDIAKIARTHIDRITGILENPAHEEERAAFAAFAAELRDDLNPSITDAEIIEMLAQHLITKPVFDALFEGYSFASHNPISQAMQGVLDLLQEHRLDKEAETLEAFYDSVKLRAEGIDSAAGKQKIVVELYDKFFRNAFPRMTERLGIVYTPVEVVDFIIHSVNDVLQQEFGQTLGSQGVHILDPFTGTGTFITRLLQSGLITPDELPHKYRHEIHANELVLLAYYIAAINIEAAYHELAGGDYQPFPGICLTDTFQLHEGDDLLNTHLADNSTRRTRQKKLDIRVILGNPPYSVGQADANDNNQNVTYPLLDNRIRDTYAARSTATNKNGLYNSYIRAIRWASDRIETSGVIAFVTNAGFVDANAADGMRKCLAREFASLYVFHLRGNQRTSGERSRKEGGKIFGSGSRAPIAISVLVKNPDAARQGQIFFCDIGDYLTREEKLARIAAYGSIAGIAQAGDWQVITPDEHGDWLTQRDAGFSEFLAMGSKEATTAPALFHNYSSGVKTKRDAWCFNASKSRLTSTMRRMIDFYNSEVTRFEQAHAGKERKQREVAVDDFINTDPTLFSWSRALKQDVVKAKRFNFDPVASAPSLYRPFFKQWLYYTRPFSEEIGQMSRIFPDAEADNVVICVSGPGCISGFTALISNIPVELCISAMKGGSQCFPLYLFDELKNSPKEVATEVPLPGVAKDAAAPMHRTRTRREAITDAGLAHFQAAYPGETIGKEDIFYYVYGLLHSPDYRERYADNLVKELPRIPCVKTAADFWAFSKAGRSLAHWHLNYERVAPYPLTMQVAGNAPLTDADYRVEKMKYGKQGKETDRSILIYNHRITLTGIPLAAYEYVVNGKPALDWVVERQCVKTDKDSGIVNDANDWAIETMKNPRYPLELFMRVVTVSLETMKIVRALPKLDI
ncbi:MAG: N-6 DNA methylase, partial [Desulfovibrio sp.]|nr:N-6 DNA methylase [Desulfovibrio sp.]